MRRSEIVAEARIWVGTPYHHLGRVLGHGVDCYGVIEMVGRALGMDIPDLRYSRVPNEAELIKNMDTYAVPIPLDQAQPGDIIILPHLGKLRHMAILTERGIIHAYEPIGRVVEHSVDGVWKRLFRRAYQYPGVVNG